MKQLFYILIVTLTLTGCHRPKELVFLHTNDTHSQIESISAKTSSNYNLGGVARRVAVINSEREKDPDLLLLDAGDFSQGTPYFNLFHGRVEIEAMNYMGYDVVTLGNHEFDNGLDTLAEVLKGAKFQVVCANYNVKGTPLQEVVKPYTILKRKGYKIGIFGLGVSPKSLIASQNFEPIKYLDPYSTAQEVATELKGKGCSVVVCLSHLGTQYEDPSIPSDIGLAKQTRDIDLIIGGHTHKVYTNDSVLTATQRPITVVQTGSKGCNVGKVVVQME